MALQITLLRRAQALIKQYFYGPKLGCQEFDFIGFPAANKQCGIWGPALASQSGNRIQARSLSQQSELFKPAVKIGESKVNTHQDGGC